MTPTERQIYEEEGEVLHAYQDSLGYWTIGVGHLIDPRRGGGIPVAVSRELLALDVKRTIHNLSLALPWTAHLDEPRFAALVNMAFQMGVEGVLGFTKTLLHIKSGRWQEAHDAMLESRWAEQTPARAKRVAQQILTGKWVFKNVTGS